MHGTQLREQFVEHYNDMIILNWHHNNNDEQVGLRFVLYEEEFWNNTGDSLIYFSDTGYVLINREQKDVIVPPTVMVQFFFQSVTVQKIYANKYQNTFH